MLSQKEVEEIQERVASPTSLGYGFTHYRNDVSALLADWLAMQRVVEAARKLSDHLSDMHEAGCDGRDDGRKCMACFGFIESGITPALSALDGKDAAAKDGE